MKANILIRPDGSVEVKENTETIHGLFPEFFKLDTVDDGFDFHVSKGVYVHVHNTKEGSYQLITVNK